MFLAPKKGYSPPAQDLPGSKTFVTPKSEKGLPNDTDREPDVVLPPGSATPRSPKDPDVDHSIDVHPSGVYNTPDGSLEIQTRPRTLPEDGESYGHPYKEDYGYPTRRLFAEYTLREGYELFAGLNTPYPAKRQRKQRMTDRLESRLWYARNRAKHKGKALRRYYRMRRDPRFSRDKKLRKKSPQRFKRRSGSVLTCPEIAFYMNSEFTMGYIHGISPMTGLVTFVLGTIHASLPVEAFLAVVTFLSEEDIDAMFDLIDAEVGLEAYDLDPEEIDCGDNLEDCIRSLTQSYIEEISLKLEGLPEPRVSDILGQVGSEVVSRTAGEIILYDQESPNQEVMFPSDTQRSPTSPTHWRMDLAPSTPPGHDLPDRGDMQPPASSRVTPGGEGKFVTVEEELIGKIAAKYSELLEKTSPRVTSRSSLGTRLRRADPTRGIWVYAVTGTSDTYTVKLKAIPQGNTKDVKKLQVMVACNCLFWRWQGPEHHAVVNGYLYGQPQGTASLPVVKDPKNEHWLCKHVVAVLLQIPELRLD